jgi:hypothetical protein
MGSNVGSIVFFALAALSLIGYIVLSLMSCHRRRLKLDLASVWCWGGIVAFGVIGLALLPN